MRNLKERRIGWWWWLRKVPFQAIFRSKKMVLLMEGVEHESAVLRQLLVLVYWKGGGTHLSKSIKEQPVMKICSKWIAEANKNDEPTWLTAGTTFANFSSSLICWTLKLLTPIALTRPKSTRASMAFHACFNRFKNCLCSLPDFEGGSVASPKAELSGQCIK